MLTAPQSVSNGRKWHIDHVNNAPTAEVALQRAYEWAKAELRDCQLRRPQDAEGFRWQIIDTLAHFGHRIHRGHPDDEYRYGPLELPGGGWVAKPGSNVRHP